ncbi:unnamed protein product [Owenia fusiformis]|uniref:Uncharacterized protein n=1 Tax=Owenia fusiformis TaxID=6347 RepID=A0A8J1UCI6_OWEFU|nr:unnamed protein product [Owenia fusiformis]
MAEGGIQKQNEASSSSETVTQSGQSTVVLKLRKPETSRQVQWTQDTVDNEFMGKKKSKCCCIYEKPKLFGESSDEDSDHDDCTGHCRGHKKKCFRDHNDKTEHAEEGGESHDPAPPQGT